MTKGWIGAVVAVGAALATAASCSKPGGPTGPSSVALGSGVASVVPDDGTHMHTTSASAEPEDKGYIDGWFEGSTVQLYYTKSYFCAPLPPPPGGSTPSPCEIGAPPEESPRPGPIPTIYAIAAAGFTPPEGTASCVRFTPCLNHPTMIDLSRIGGSPTGLPVSHSHVLSAHGGGWFNTVNIRVFSLAAWNEIANAKSLARVRELQGDNPQVGTPGVISADTPTNIYFFIASWRPN